MEGGWVDIEQAWRIFEQSSALYRALGDRWGVARTLLGPSHGIVSAEKQPACEESLAIFRALGDKRGEALALLHLSTSLRNQERAAEAERTARESVALWRDTDDWFWHAYGHMQLGNTLDFQGRFREALSAYKACKAVWDEYDARGQDFAMAHLCLGAALLGLGRYAEGRAQGRRAAAFAGESGDLLGGALMITGLAALGQGEWAEAWSVFQESVDVYQEAGESTRSAWVGPHVGLVCAALRLGEPRRAREHLLAALRIRDQVGILWHWDLWTAFLPVTTAALLLADGGAPGRAVELYALASRHPYIGNSHFWEDIAGTHIAAAAATLSPEVVEAAQARGQARGRARDPLATVRELLEEFEAEAGSAVPR